MATATTARKTPPKEKYNPRDDRDLLIKIEEQRQELKRQEAEALARIASSGFSVMLSKEDENRAEGEPNPTIGITAGNIVTLKPGYQVTDMRHGHHYLVINDNGRGGLCLIDDHGEAQRIDSGNLILIS